MDRRRTVSNALAHAFVALAAALAALSAAAQTFEGAMSGHWWNPAREREGQFVAFESVNGRRVAFLASRTNTVLSIPMLMSMVGFGHGGFFI